MRSSVKSKRRRISRKAMLSLQAALSGSLLAAPWVFAAGPGDQSHEGHATPVAMPGWTQTLKGQTVVENAMEGSGWQCREDGDAAPSPDGEVGEAGGQTMPRRSNLRCIQRNVDDAPVYGTGRQQLPARLNSSKGEPVMTSGGKCPANAPVKI